MDESSSFHAGITATIRLDVVLSVATGLSKGRDREREREGRFEESSVGFTRRIGHRTDLANLSYAATERCH